jgi:hypothetical protein
MTTLHIVLYVISVNLALLLAFILILGVERTRQRRRSWWRGP